MDMKKEQIQNSVKSKQRKIKNWNPPGGGEIGGKGEKKTWDQISARAAMKEQIISTLHKHSERIEENGMGKKTLQAFR